MTTKTARAIAMCDVDMALAGDRPDIDASHQPNRNTALLLMNEALARVRMWQAQRPTHSSARPPARLVAMKAAQRRDHYGQYGRP